MEIKTFISKLEPLVKKSCQIDSELFEKFEVKRGLRNADGSGVLVGLTNIGEVIGYKKEGDKVVAVPGRLLYRGIDIEDIVAGFQNEKRHGFDETVFLLLTGLLPNSAGTEGFLRSPGIAAAPS